MNEVTTVLPNGAGGAGAGTDPAGSTQNTETKPTTTATNFDPSKVSDEEFAKVFDDPRTFQHSRFKELAQAKQERDELKAKQKQEQEEAMKKRGEFEQLAKQKEEEANTLRQELQTGRIDNALLAASTKIGVVDPDAVLKLVDRSKISVDATTGQITGAEEALKGLLENKPYLAGKQPTSRLGSPSNPNNQNTGDLKRFKHSEIQNPVFYREHEAEILASMKAGLIENDLE